MGEADWWLCSGCSSLNNLSARKCYSCRQRKPKDAALASEYLGYEAIVAWDGKVRLHQLPIEPGLEAPVAAQPTTVPPLRDPIARDTLAVAPRPPHPARITYRLDPPPPTGQGPMPISQGPAPIVAVGPGPATVPDVAEPWPHWVQLLDGPTPHADRLRQARPSQEASPLDGDASATPAASNGSGRTLRLAMQEARGETPSSCEFIPWPKADRPRQGRKESGEETRSPSPATRPTG